MILTPTSIDVRPAKLTRAYAVKSSPTWIGSLKSTLSTDTVTHGFEAWRIAATAATRSTSDRTTPPNTLPMMFACCGIISSDMIVSESRGCLDCISSPPAAGRTRRSPSGTSSPRSGGGASSGSLRAADQVVENAIDLVVADAVVPLGGLPRDQVGCGRLPEDHLGNAHVARQGAHLCLEQVTQRVHGRRVVGVPGEVAEQPLRLVAGPDRQRFVLGRQVEQHDHALARHHVAAARGIGIPVLLHLGEIAVHRRGDVDRD